jgi:hypothetical protein
VLRAQEDAASEAGNGKGDPLELLTGIGGYLLVKFLRVRTFKFFLPESSPQFAWLTARRCCSDGSSVK